MYTFLLTDVTTVEVVYACHLSLKTNSIFKIIPKNFHLCFNMFWNETCLIDIGKNGQCTSLWAQKYLKIEKNIHWKWTKLTWEKCTTWCCFLFLNIFVMYDENISAAGWYFWIDLKITGRIRLHNTKYISSTNICEYVSYVSCWDIKMIIVFSKDADQIFCKINHFLLILEWNSTTAPNSTLSYVVEF